MKQGRRVLTYNMVKKEFEDKGYKLITTEFSNSRTKMDCICPQNHECSLSYSSLKSGWGCSKCGSELSASKKRHSIYFVKEVFNKEGYTVVSEEYKNNKQMLDLICPKGHRIKLSYTRFVSKGHRCKICSKDSTISVSFDAVNAVFVEEGYTLTTKSLNSLRDVVSYICSDGHRGKVSLYNFIHNNSRCPLCAGNVRRSIKDLKRDFEDEGYILVSSEYTNNKTAVRYICPKGHEGKIRPDSFDSGARCRKCSYELRKSKKRHDYNKVKQDFFSEGYILISKNYEGVDSKVFLQCPSGHVFVTTYHRFMSQNSRCWCSYGRRMSKISQEWLDSLGIKIENREYFLKGFGRSRGVFVDGFDPETNTVYEFLGDYWHGNPEVHDSKEINSSNKKTFGELYQETNHRLRILEEAGYNVVYIWEKDFKRG